MFDHSNLFVKEPWFSTMSPHKWCEQVGVAKEDTEAYLEAGSPEIRGLYDASNNHDYRIVQYICGICLFRPGHSTQLKGGKS